MLVLVLLFLSCDFDDSGSIGSLSSDKAIYVNQINSTNKGSGTKENPYKTISSALRRVSTISSVFLGGDATIYVAGGNYNADNGEKFPIVIPYNTKLLRWNENNESVFINGSGENDSGQLVSIILQGDNEINSVTVNSNNQIGVLSTEGKNTISSSKFLNNQVAIAVLKSSQINIQNNSLYKNIRAIEVLDEGSISLISNILTKNKIGIFLSANGMIERNTQNNYIIESTDCDFFHEGSQNLKLQGIRWDTDVLTFKVKKECKDGNNIVNIGTGTIDYQDIPEQNIPLFSSQRIINIISPEFGETLFSTTPDFVYNATSNKYIMVGLWTELPKISDNVIRNPESMIWYWHTGMNNSPIGYVSYNDGITVIGGNFDEDVNKNEIPTPLEKGRAYYLAVWEWDDNGINIIASSNVSYFIVGL